MRHINIDVFTRFLPPGLMRIRNRIIFLATAIAASILGFAALKLVLDEKSFGEKAFLGVDVWLLQLVLPVAFFLISYRSLLNLMVPPAAAPVEWDDLAGLEADGAGEVAIDGGPHGVDAGDTDAAPDGSSGAVEDSDSGDTGTAGDGEEGPKN
jgi:hypothetical protein